MDQPEERAAALYADALRKALAPFLAVGGTQKEIAAALNTAPATLSRYLSGERVASQRFLRDLRNYFQEQGMPWPPEVYENLDRLCGKAHAASGSPTVQLAQLKEELERLGLEQQKDRQISEARLGELQQQADRLTRELQEALDRAQTAEGLSEILQARVAQQDDSLRHAQDYIHQVEAELAQQREQAEQLQRALGVLREQNRRLVEEQQHVPGVSTQDKGFEAPLAGLRKGISQQPGESGRRPASQGSKSGPWNPRTKPSALPVSGSATAAPEKYAPVRDTLIALGLMAVICIVGLAYSASLRAAPGPGIGKLVLAAVVAFVVSLLCWGASFAVADKYMRNSWTSDWPAPVVLCSGPLFLAAGIGAPFLVGSDVLGHWLADAVGLL
ncbi:helix-turn-helix domain-containing protein [Streptomyces sp. NPDC096033]|uniref:helix-turn-helix domain-containing protein n=1 Tax=Streptomyces sp. NPDC096033 TaxID=3366071 RepID=UPI0037F7607B